MRYRELAFFVFVSLAVGWGSRMMAQAQGNNVGVKFVEISARAGISSFHCASGGSAKDYILESVGGGVAVLDYNLDGWLDILLISGATFEELDNPQGPRPCRNKLFRNNKDGTFTDVTESAGLARWGWGMGAAVADFDNDGFPEIYVTNFGSNVLYRNNGDGTFTDVTERAGVAAGSWSAGAAWGDFDNDGHLDLYVARYVDFNRAEIPAKGSSKSCQYRGIAVQCGPRGLKGLTGILYRNNGDGTFSDATLKVLGPDVPEYYGFTPLWFDADDDGWLDLYVATDSTPNLFYRNRGDGTFEEIGALAGCAYSRDGLEQAGMGADFGDFTRDGKSGIFVTNFSDDYNTLYRNLGRGLFSDVTQEAKLISASWRELGWATKFFDFDLDGWLDLFVVNGHVYPEVEQWQMDTRYRQKLQLFRNQGDGTFQDVTREVRIDLLEAQLGRGAAFGDLDNDGDIDIVVNNLDGSPWLLLCESPAASQWILIHLEGTRSNRDAIGTKVRIRSGGIAQHYQVRQGGGFLSSNDVRVHFGLGTNAVVEGLEIRWPSGLVQNFKDIKSRQIIRVREGDANLATWPARGHG